MRDTGSRGNVAKPAVYLYSFVRDRVTKEIDGIKRIQNGLNGSKDVSKIPISIKKYIIIINNIYVN